MYTVVTAMATALVCPAYMISLDIPVKTTSNKYQSNLLSKLDKCLSTLHWTSATIDRPTSSIHVRWLAAEKRPRREPVWSERVGNVWGTRPLSSTKAQYEGRRSHRALGSWQCSSACSSVLFPLLTSQELTESEIWAVLLKLRFISFIMKNTVLLRPWKPGALYNKSSHSQ